MHVQEDTARSTFDGAVDIAVAADVAVDLALSGLQINPGEARASLSSHYPCFVPRFHSEEVQTNNNRLIRFAPGLHLNSPFSSITPGLSCLSRM